MTDRSKLLALRWKAARQAYREGWPREDWSAWLLGYRDHWPSMQQALAAQAEALS